MSPSRPTIKELDALIEEVTVDAYNDSEQLTAFETAFDGSRTSLATAPSSARRSRYYHWPPTMTGVNWLPPADVPVAVIKSHC